MKYSTADKLSDAELIATILNKAGVDDACHRIAEYVLHPRVSDSGYADLSNDMGSVTANRMLYRIEAATELGRRVLLSSEMATAPRVADATEVHRIMAPRFVGFEREVFYALALNVKNDLKRITEVSVGSLNASIVHPRELFREAVRISAASVVMVHNHPSGDPTPSGADIALTRRMIKAGDVLGIEVLDHIVIGGGDAFVSMREAGLM